MVEQVSGPYNPRNELGWRIPRKGTASAAIYDLLLQGKTRNPIAIALNMNPVTVGVLIHKIRHPERIKSYYKAKVQAIETGTCSRCKQPFAYIRRKRDHVYCDDCKVRNNRDACRDHYQFKRKPAREAR